MPAQRLRARMDELGYTIAKLADKSGVSDSTIKRALSGAKLNRSTAELLADALGVPANELFAPENEPNDRTVTQSAPILNQSEPEDEEMNRDITALLDELRASHREKIEILRAALRQKDRWIAVLAAALGLLVFGLILWLGYDITHPDVGWFQR